LPRGTNALTSDDSGRVAAIAAHMGDLEQVKSLVQQTVSIFGGFDVVVNNAATSLLQQFGAITPEAWRKSLAVNVTGPLFLVQEACSWWRWRCRSRARVSTPRCST